jgi:uncharacterized membrane protein YfcA
MDLSLADHLAAGAAAVAAGAVNALAGGGTLISFPVLTAIGVPSVGANATNTVALCPGYVGGTYTLREEIRATGRPLRHRIVIAAAGGVAGAALLLLTGDKTFREIVPYLILVSCVLLATQDRLRAWVGRHRGDRGLATPELVAVFVSGAYGGYFGAGLGIMLIAILGLFTDIAFTQLNAIKQPLAAAINLSAAAFLAFSDKVEWSLVLVMAPASLLGGAAGGRLTKIVDGKRLRAVVIAIGVVVAIVYLVR